MKWDELTVISVDDDQTCDFKDRVGVEPLYNSVEFDEPDELSSGSS